VTVDYINRFKSAKEKETIQKLKAGKLTSSSVRTPFLAKRSYKDLGLLITDESRNLAWDTKKKSRP
jgi:transcription-repair coupling factor (superfamily II helicase)